MALLSRIFYVGQYLIYDANSSTGRTRPFRAEFFRFVIMLAYDPSA